MALGFDIEAAEVALALRKELEGVQVVAIIPFADMQRSFSSEWQRRFERIVAEANETITLASHYSSEVYAVRNNFLVDNSSACIAYFDGSKGGTAYTVHRAVKSLLRLTNIYNNPQRKLF